MDIGQGCLEAIAADALRNPRTNFMAANFAGPLGLVPSSDPNGPRYQSKQVEFSTPDGLMHYFAVDSGSWEKAVLIRIGTNQGEPRIDLFVVSRRGTLVAAGRIDGRDFSRLNLNDAATRADFQREAGLWTTAGPTYPCRRRA
jgi:hypothetical protein